MCGFAGFWATGLQRPRDLERAALRMSEVLRHRGPDDHGTWSDADSGVAFGFRRLSILDLSTHGHQPIQSPSGRYGMVFNGEIYNFKRLRSRLEQSGYPFRGTSDSEVLVTAFEEWGTEAVSRLVGMFAIALWDRRDRKLHLIRDRLGIKPLYVAQRNGLVTFGSELKALVAGPGFDGTIDRDALASYFRYHFVPEPNTVYASVKKLLPGTILTIESPDREPATPSPYWSMTEAALAGLDNPVAGSDGEVLEATRALLQEVVADHLYADVPLGAFLSGGIDSSLVVGLMQEVASDPLKTYSISFAERDYDEAAHAERVANHIGTTHTELSLHGVGAQDVVPLMPTIFDEPFGNSSAMASLLLCRAARQEVVVAVSGSGGDEIFGGYSRYVHGERIVRSLKPIPAPARRVLSSALTAVPSVAWDSAYSAIQPLIPKFAKRRMPNIRGVKVHRLGELLGQPGSRQMYRSMLSALEDPGRFVIGGEERYGGFEMAFSAIPSATLMDKFMLTDQHGYLVGDQLTSIDRVSMSVGLEVRVPLLDHRVAEFAWRLPRRFKKREGVGKWILRQLLDLYVPRSLVDRPKMGLSLPIGRWLVGPLRSWAEELLDPQRLTREGILSPEPVQDAWSQLLSGRQQEADAVWSILMFQAWKEQWQG